MFECIICTVHGDKIKQECYVNSRTGLLFLTATGLVKWDTTHHAFVTENIVECKRMMEATDTTYLNI